MVGTKRTKEPDTSYVKTLYRMRTEQLANTLIDGIEKVLPPDQELFRDAILEDGVLEPTQSIRYLPYNQQEHPNGDDTIRLSLVALLNNRRMEKYHLKGLKLRLNRYLMLFNRNHLDRFVNLVRCDAKLIRILASSSVEYSVLGIVTIDSIRRRRYFFNQRLRTIRPLMLVTGVLEADLPYLDLFAEEHKIEQVKRLGLPLYKTIKKAAPKKSS
jgi:hypothetical protein